MTEFDIIQRAEAALSNAGLLLNKPIDLTGKLTRCGTLKRPNGLDGAYKVHTDMPPNVWLCNYHNGGIGETVKLYQDDEIQSIDDAERKKLQERIRQRKEASAKEREKTLKQLAESAKRIFDNSILANETNAYLQLQGVKPCHNLKQGKDGSLIVPVYDDTGKIASVQFIAGNKEKRFLKGGLPEIFYFFIPAENGKKDGVLLICEGLATGLALNQGTGLAVLVAFNAGNLQSMAEFAREKYPNREIMICADNDKPCKAYPEAGGTGVACAKRAAKSIGAKLAICPLYNDRNEADYNDLYKDFGGERVKTEIEKALAGTNSTDKDEWQEIVDFTANNLPKFDAEKLPDLLKEFCVELAEEKQVPLELCVSMALVALATATQGSYRVKIKDDYKETLNLYVLCPLDPANRKSAVVEACSKPLREWENEQAQKLEAIIKHAKSERATIEKAIEAKRRKAGSGNNASISNIKELHKEIEALELELPEIPVLPRLLADSITPEALASLLKVMNESIAIISAEGGIFDILAGIYSQGTPNLDLILKGHCGESYRYDRKTSEPIILNNSTITIGLCPQLISLSDRDKSKVFRQRGLDGRFLYFMPESLLGRRKLEPRAMNPQTKINFEKKIKSLLPMEWTNNRPEPVTLELSQDAYRHWLAFSGQIEKELQEGGEFEYMRDWAGKLAGHTARIAALFHLIEYDKSHELKISGQTMSLAIYMGGFLAEHAKAAYQLMGTDEKIEGAKKILSWIKRNRLDSFSSQNCWQGVKGYFKHMTPVKEALQVLIERGMIKEKEIINRGGAGKPRNPDYLVNPVIIKKSFLS